MNLNSRVLTREKENIDTCVGPGFRKGLFICKNNSDNTTTFYSKNFNFGTFSEEKLRKNLEEKLNKKFEEEIPIKTNNFRNNFRNISVLDIISKGTEKGINLRCFNTLSSQYQGTEIKRDILKNAMNLLFDLMNKAELPLYIKENDLQSMLYNRYYLKKGESGFDQLIKNSYGGIIYCIRCKMIPEIFHSLAGRVYIGRTHKSFLKRLMEHIKDSLDSYKTHTRRIEISIINALNQEYDIYRLWEQYYLSPVYIKNKILSDLTRLLISKYFDLDIIEVHNNYNTTYNREKFYIKNYNYYINNTLIIGTKNPNGLNMTINTSTKYISLPLYDIAFMIALGLKTKLIVEILNKEYNLDVNKNLVNTRVREFWKSSENAQEELLKSNFQALLEQNKYNFTEIRDAFSYSHKGLYKIFKIFFYGLTFNQLRASIIQKNFNWDFLPKIAEDLKDDKKIRGISPFKWKEWFVRGVSLDEIAELTGFRSGRGMRAFLYNNKKIITEFGGKGYEKIVDKCRRERTIERLLDGRKFTLEWIYVNDFGLNSREDYKKTKKMQDYHFERQLTEFYERLFEYKLTITDLRARNPQILLYFKD